MKILVVLIIMIASFAFANDKIHPLFPDKVSLGMNRLAFEVAHPEAKIFDMSDEGVDLTKPFSGCYIEMDLNSRDKGSSYYFEDDILVRFSFFQRPKKIREVLSNFRAELKEKYGEPKKGDFGRSNRAGRLERVTKEVYGKRLSIVLIATEKGGIEVSVQDAGADEVQSFDKYAEGNRERIHKGPSTVVDLLVPN